PMRRGLPAAGAAHDGRHDPHGLWLSAAARRLHRLQALVHGLFRRLVRCVSRAGRGGRMNGVLKEGSHAIAEAAIQAGCRFYAGYPITPSTEILEYMSLRLPEVGEVCMNAESELEAINMVWGAAGCGVRAMIASTGQGISLMQESFAELANAEIPCVIVNMMRGQGDYFQATRGGGHGDYRHLVLAPHTVQEAVDLVM